MSKARITNERLIALAYVGVLNLNYSNAGAEGGYNIYRTLKSLRNALKEYDSDKSELLSQNISKEDLAKVQAFEKERGLEEKTSGITEEEYNRIMQPFVEVHSQLLKDSREVEVRPVSSQTWFAIKKDNKFLSYEMDDALEGIFWKDSEGE